MKYITEEEMERQVNKVNKLARERFRLYKIKNRDGNKTKGISTKNELVLFEFINQYPLLNSHVIISF